MLLSITEDTIVHTFRLIELRCAVVEQRDGGNDEILELEAGEAKVLVHRFRAAPVKAALGLPTL